MTLCQSLYRKTYLCLKAISGRQIHSVQYLYWSSWRRFSSPLTSFTSSPLNLGNHYDYSKALSSSSKQGGEIGDRSLLDFSREAEADGWNFTVIPCFISLEEEQALMADVSRSLRGKKYQFDHWDGAIEGYRETEKSHWSELCKPIINRLKETATTVVAGKSLTPLEEVHVLDLAREGHIKPHIDNVKFCGDAIAGISLLSPSIMNLQHSKVQEKWINALLPRLSLYIMKGAVRYEYNHAIPDNAKSEFKGQPILKDRRVSVICRTFPIEE